MQYLQHRNLSMQLRWLLGAPFIASMIIPVLIVDVWTEMYHHICFPLYGIPLVKRRKYIRIDRQKLKYLNWRQKLNCMYCGYVNGALHYRVEVAGRTEHYRCGIMHQKMKGVIPQPHQIEKEFAEYCNEDDFKQKYT